MTIEETDNENLRSTSVADDRENQQEEDQKRRNGKRSRSIEETKGRNLDLSLRKSGMKSDERHEIDSRSKAEKKNKESQIHDYRDSSNQQQQRLRDVEMQRRRYETESRILREERDRSPDLRRRYDETASDLRQSKSEWRYHKRSGRRYERLQSGGYIVYPGKKDCISYFQTGTCLNGSSCKFKHPATLPRELPKNTIDLPVCKHFRRGNCKKGSECDFPHAMDRDVPVVCKYFPKGTCKNGSDCRFRHVMDRDGSGPMPQAKSMDPRATESEWEHDDRSMDRGASDSEWECDGRTERRYETESVYRPKKRSRTILDSRPRDSKGTFEDIRQRRHEIVPESEQERRVVNKENEVPENRFMAAQRARERREAQDNMQEQRSGGRIKDLSYLINPIAKAILRERMSKIENDRLSMEESPLRSSQQSSSTK